jgi:hypothetical protein
MTEIAALDRHATFLYHPGMPRKHAQPTVHGACPSWALARFSRVSGQAPTFKMVPVGKRDVAFVDEADYERVMEHRWSKRTSTRATYAYTVIEGKRVDMHGFILGEKPGMMIDHESRYGLDNRRENLRWATRSQNQMNIEKPRFRKGTSRFKGVDRINAKKPWRAKIRHNRVGIFLGTFAEEEQAARAYDTAARRLFGAFACLNFKSIHVKPTQGDHCP